MLGSSPAIWYWTLSTALIGFVAGLTSLMKQGQQYTWRTTILADIICTVAVFAGLSLAIILSFHIFNYIFNVALPTAISGFILLFISLIIYKAIVKPRKRTSATV